MLSSFFFFCLLEINVLLKKGTEQMKWFVAMRLSGQIAYRCSARIRQAHFVESYCVHYNRTFSELNVFRSFL